MRQTAGQSARPSVDRRRQQVAPADYQRPIEFQSDYEVNQCGLGGCCGDCGDVGCCEATCGCEPGCGCDVDCCDIDCCDGGCCEPVGCGSTCAAAAGGCYVGFELTYLKPYYEQNVAFNEQAAVGNDSDFFTDNHRYDREPAPRVSVGWENSCGIGLAATWWQFDHASDLLTLAPTASSVVSTPLFGERNPISDTVANVGRVLAISQDPTRALATQTGLRAYTIDLEGTKTTSFCCWDMGVSCGLRYSRIEQSTAVILDDAQFGRVGTLAYRQSFEGFGPTLSLHAYRPLTCQCGFFGKARGALLCGDARSVLATAITDTISTQTGVLVAETDQEGVLPILEMQIGYRYEGAPRADGACIPFMTAAFEGQYWHGAGNAHSQEGSLGLFGLTSAFGVKW